MTLRHSWSDPYRLSHKTERHCIRCGLVKVTRHEPGVRSWIEWWRGLEQVESERTPACEIVAGEARAA